METYYLIDYENVGKVAFDCCNCTRKDHLLLFYTKNKPNIDLNIVVKLQDVSVEYINVPAGKQSTDMHIGSYLGYLAGRQQGKILKKYAVVIVSSDTDYDKVIEFWKKESGIDAKRLDPNTKNAAHKQRVYEENLAKRERAVAAAEARMKAQKKADEKAEKKAAEKRQNKAKAENKPKNANKPKAENKPAKQENKPKAEKAVKTENKPKTDNQTKAENKPKTANQNKTKNKPAKVTATVGENKIDKQPKPQKGQDKMNVNSSIQKELSKAKLDAVTINSVASIATKNLKAEDGKLKTHNAIIAQFGSEKGTEIYNSIKKYI